MKKTKVWCLSLMMVIFMAGLWYFLKGSRPTTAPILVKVQTVRVKTAAMDEIIETLGFLSAEQEATLSAGVSGRVAKISVKAGHHVEKNTVLLIMLPTSEIRAPFDGYLSEWQVKEGETVREGTAFASLLNTDTLLVSYRVPEQYAGRLKNDQKIYLKSPDGQHEFTSQVNFISPRIDRDSYTILLKAAVDNPQKILWPGMSLHIRHVIEHHDRALVIPDTALKPTLEGYEIYVVSEGKIKRVPVVLGERNGGRVHILEGVALHDAVVLVHSDAVREGAQVEPIDWAGDW